MIKNFKDLKKGDVVKFDCNGYTIGNHSIYINSTVTQTVWEEPKLLKDSNDVYYIVARNDNTLKGHPIAFPKPGNLEVEVIGKVEIPF